MLKFSLFEIGDDPIVMDRDDVEHRRSSGDKSANTRLTIADDAVHRGAHRRVVEIDLRQCTSSLSLRKRCLGSISLDGQNVQLSMLGLNSSLCGANRSVSLGDACFAFFELCLADSAGAYWRR